MRGYQVAGLLGGSAGAEASMGLAANGFGHGSGLGS